MSIPSESPDLDRFRGLLRERDAQRAAGQAIPEAAAERIARVITAGEPEPSVCDVIEMQLPEYIGAELRGEAAARLFPEIHRHLLACLECAALHAELLELELGPEVAPLPAPGLAALRWSIIGKTPGPFVTRLVQQVLQRLDVLVADFDELMETFSELVNDLGERLTWGPVTANAFGLAGDEAAAPARYLVATWQAGLAVRDALATRPGSAARRHEFEQLLRRSAQSAARLNGIKGAAGRRFVDVFVELALAPDMDAGGVDVEGFDDEGFALPG